MWIADYSRIVDQGGATANNTQVEDFRRPYQMSSLVRLSHFFFEAGLGLELARHPLINRFGEGR
jgi:hypothetical protein